MATIYDIAKKAAVSHTTVTRALKNSPSIKPETRDRIRRIAEELGYHPNLMASSLKTGRSKRIAVLIPQLNIIEHAGLVSALESNCSADGYETVLMQISSDVAKDRLVWEHLLQGSFDAVICYLYEFQPLRDLIEAYLAQRKSVLVLGPPYDFVPQPGLFAVDVNNLPAVRDAVRMLVAQGHRRIVFTMREERQAHSCVVERYRELLRDNGVTDWDPIFFFQHGPHMDIFQTGYQAAGELFAEKSGTTAVICENDLFALGLMRRLSELGCRIPEDVSVIGSDNQRFSEYYPVSLTTIAMRSAEFAVMAWRIIHQQILEPDFDSIPSSNTLRANLIVRESTGVAAKHPWQFHSDNLVQRTKKDAKGGTSEPQ